MTSVILNTDIVSDSLSLSATTAASGYPASNLITDKKLSTWRSTAITAQTITATFSTSYDVNLVALAHHNLIASSTIRVRLYTLSADVSPIYDSGIITLSHVQPPPAGFDTNNSLSFGFGGGNYFCNLSDTYSIQKIIVIVASSGNPDGFIEIGRLLAGDAIISSKVLYDAGFGYSGLSTQTLSEAGQKTVERLPQSKSLSLSLSNLNATESTEISNLIRRNGSHTPVFISIFPLSEEQKARKYEIYGYIDDTQLQYFSHNLERVDLRINEV